MKTPDEIATELLAANSSCCGVQCAPETECLCRNTIAAAIRAERDAAGPARIAEIVQVWRIGWLCGRQASLECAPDHEKRSTDTCCDRARRSGIRDFAAEIQMLEPPVRAPAEEGAAP
jgi:hypothetical protein